MIFITHNVSRENRNLILLIMKLYKLFLITVVLLAVGCGKEQVKIDIDATELLENVYPLSRTSRG